KYRSPLLFEHLNLHEHIYDSVESGAANEKRRKEVVKPTQLPREHTIIQLKCAKQFASLFANVSVIVFQDNKAKVGLGVPAVSRTFSMLQSINEPVKVADYNFLAGFSQLLVLSVYLIIKPNEMNNELRTGQIAIFVRHQWSFGTSSLTHMQDLQCLTQDPQYNKTLKTNGKIRPIWMLLGTATLSGKLAGITLLIDYFGTHLNTQENVIHPELQNVLSPGHGLKSIAICANTLLISDDIPISKDGHFVNPIYLLEYCDYIKVPGYDLHCPSLDKLTYLHLCCPECKKPFEQNSLDDCSVFPLYEVQLTFDIKDVQFLQIHANRHCDSSILG
ncbi:2907_t:CDS:2, partial [Gigaspora margarita]